MRIGKYKINRNFLLSGLASKHLQTHVETAQRAEYVAFQFPEERSRIRFLFFSIVTTGTPLLVSIAKLGLEDKIMIDDFEKANAHPLARDSVAKIKSASDNTDKDDLDLVSEAEANARSTELEKSIEWKK